MSEHKVVAVTGADGFIGRNLMLRLREAGHEGVPLTRGSASDDWVLAIAQADVVVHLAGVNRPADGDFSGNVGGAEQLVAAIGASGRAVPVIVASSTKAVDPTPYGASKRAGEDVLIAAGTRHGAPVAIYRLPNVFGKWCRPNYNSAVATFCHNIARGEPIRVDDPDAALTLVYVDDVIDRWLSTIAAGVRGGQVDAAPTYVTTVGAVADLIRGFAADRDDAMIADVGVGLTRALYATYVSYLPPERFDYPLTAHTDPRGSFSEMLKTRTSGQFSFFTAHPGVTRGGHYHHTKTEKFLIVHGRARFRFRHMLTGEVHAVDTSADEPRVVETIPGWTHDVTNIGDEVMVSMLWANELFDRERPDTISAPVAA